MIEHYKFGNMVINGQSYDKDLLIYDGTVLPNWWRDKGHLLQLSDLDAVLQETPEVVLIGTGKFGMMRINKEVTDYFEQKGIDAYFEKTAKAVARYNELINSGKQVVAGFHLTC